MKKINLFYVILLLAVTFTSCKKDDTTIGGPDLKITTTIIDFEDVTLNEDGITTETFESKGIKFQMNGSAFWNGGFACSSHTDSKAEGYDGMNLYIVIAGRVALNSKKFGVVYDTAYVHSVANVYGAYKIKNIQLTNTTTAYYIIKNGSDYSKKFEAGDWFKVTITGFSGSTETGKVDYYLADFRNGKSFISDKWEKVDVSKLGEVDKVRFTFDSSDKGEWGLNTPKYVCIDNVEFTQEVKK